MERLIEWFNAGEMVTMTITDNKVFSCHTILEIDNLSFIDDQVNIMTFISEPMILKKSQMVYTMLGIIWK